MRKAAALILYLWMTVTVTLAYTGVKLIPQLVILGLVTITSLLQVVFWQRKWRPHLAIPLMVLMLLGASMVSCVQLGLWLFPPVTPDGHPVMAIGQAFWGIAGGFLLSVGLGYLLFARLKPDPWFQAIWTWCLNLALAAAFLIDLFL